MLVPAATVTARGQGVTTMPNALLTTQVVVDMLGIRGVSVLMTRARKLKAPAVRAPDSAYPLVYLGCTRGYMSEVVRLDWPSVWPSLGVCVFRPF